MVLLRSKVETRGIVSVVVVQNDWNWALVGPHAVGWCVALAGGQGRVNQIGT